MEIWVVVAIIGGVGVCLMEHLLAGQRADRSEAPTPNTGLPALPKGSG